MEDSRFAEASLRVFTPFYFMEGLGGWEVYCVDGRTEIKCGKSENRQMDTRTFLVKKDKTFCRSHVGVQRISRGAVKCAPFEHLQMNLPGSI